MSSSNVITAVILIAFVTLAVGCEIRVWNECLTTNSWFYCMRVLNK